jgi:hypothetical protein
MQSIIYQDGNHLKKVIILEKDEERIEATEWEKLGKPPCFQEIYSLFHNGNIITAFENNDWYVMQSYALQINENFKIGTSSKVVNGNYLFEDGKVFVCISE